jgi:hypothetical protein
MKLRRRFLSSVQAPKNLDRVRARLGVQDAEARGASPPQFFHDRSRHGGPVVDRDDYW